MSIRGFLSPGRKLALSAAFALACLTPALGVPASAGGLDEWVYADSFGNLIVRSPAGYKRVLVGKGYLADELAHDGRHAPKVVYLEEEEDGHLYLRERKKCRYGALRHGRSYMYGLPENAVPVLRAC